MFSPVAMMAIEMSRSMPGMIEPQTIPNRMVRVPTSARIVRLSCEHDAGPHESMQICSDHLVHGASIGSPFILVSPLAYLVY
jgi:hypothetical protein